MNSRRMVAMFVEEARFVMMLIFINATVGGSSMTKNDLRYMENMLGRLALFEAKV